MIRRGLGCHTRPRPVFVHSLSIHLPCSTSENSLALPCCTRRLLVSRRASWLLTAWTGGFLVLVLAQGQQPPSIRVGRFGPHAPDAVCVNDALGKPGRETNPSLFRRAELVPGVGSVISPVPTSDFSAAFELSSFREFHLLRSSYRPGSVRQAPAYSAACSANRSVQPPPAALPSPGISTTPPAVSAPTPRCRSAAAVCRHARSAARTSG